MKTFFHRAINILILAVFVFGQLQPAAALQEKKRAVDTGRPSSSFSTVAGRYTPKALRQGFDTSPANLPAQGGAPAEKFSNLPSDTPAVDKQPAFIDTAGAARLSLRLSALPRFVTGGGPVAIRWKISGALRQFQALSLQVRLPAGYEPGAGLQNAYDAATRVLTFPVSTAGGQFVLNANNPVSDAVFSAAIFSGSQALAETSLVLPKHETFSAGKGSSPSTGSGYHAFSARQGKIRVEIPGAALPEDAIINIGSPVDEAMPEYSLSGSPFEIDAVGKRSKKDLHRFSDDITIQVSYADLNIPAEQLPNLLMYWYNPDTKEWEALPSHVDPQTRTIQAFTDHFTVFDIGVNNWQASHLPTVDAFQVSSFTGAGTYSLPIEVPPGPGGLQPKLALDYNSQVVDQSTMMTQASWVGMGWSLEAGSIERNTQGGTFILNVAGISALIVKDASGVYHSADENFMKFSLDTIGNKWTVWDKSGNVYFFERAARTRYNTTAPDGSHCGSTWLTYKWSLTRIRNAFGQELAYNYADETKTMKFDVYSSSKQKCITADLQTVTTATFPVSITYPGGRTRLRFEREARADYPSGWATDGAFHVFSRTRLKSIHVEQDANGDGTFETLIRRYDLLYAADDAADIIWPGIAWSAGDKTLTLREVRQYGLGGAQSLPSTTFTYGDNLHLTRAENGYGGAVEFDYARWVYEPSGRPSQRSLVKFGAAGQPCTTGHFTARSGYVTCFENGGVPDQLGVRGVAINTYMINPSLGSNMMRPGGTYLIKASGGPDPHVTVNFGLFDGSTDTFVPFTGGSSVVDLPVTASRADVLVQAVQNGGATTEFGRFFNISIQLLPSFYRVTQKRLYDGQGNVYPFSYGYQGPAVNDSVTSPGSCSDTQLFASPPTCTQYVEKYSEFRGHSQVTETGPDGRQAVTTFNQDDVLKGRPTSVTVRDANGNVLTQQSTTYTSTTLSLSKFMVNYIGFGHSWIRTASEEARIYDANGATYHAIQTAYTYEATYGNLTGKVESSWNGSGWDLYRTTRIDTFPYNSASLYLTGLPARQQVLDANNNVLAEVLNIYDANSTYNTAPTAGRLSATRIWVQGSDYSQASFGYDAWGNRTSVTAYSAYGTDSSAPTSGARTVTTAFDSTYHTYPVSETDPLIGQAYTWTFDTALGLPLSETDANGQTISASYDAFGRMTTLVRPGDDSAHPTIRATYNDTLSPFRIDLQQRIEGDTYYVIRNTYDGLGRKFKTETGSSADGAFSLYNTMLAAFNAYGKPLSQSTPFGPGETPFYATTTYDALGRPLTVTTPDGANAGYSYDGLTTSVTDANNHTTSTAMDVWGRTVSVTPPAGPGVAYQYDPLNRLTTAERGGEVTVITYDNAGRKTAMSDPDMGNWSYAYDALGALVSQTDARGCTLGLSYDMLGRLTGKASSGDCGTQVNTSYGYDAGTYGKGRRTSMTDSSGSTSWSYDARGRAASENKTIDSQSFVTAFTYNSAGLPVTMTYPDGEVVTNTYTPQMMLQSVSGADNYVMDTSYDTAGRMTSRAFGNGTQTDYSYYAWDQQGGRLATLTTSRLADQATLQNLAYSYDAIGNINTITDAVAGETQSFGYDALDRLVSVSATGGPAPYGESYTYDPLTGNLAAKAGVTYTYDVDHPHAVSSLSNGNSYDYDANGNQITRTVNGQTFVLAYDAEGRLVSVVSLNPQTPPPTATASPTNTASPTDTPTATETAALTETPTATEPATDTPAPTGTLTPTVTDTATETPIPTDAATPTETNTPDPAQTETAASTEDPTLTATLTPTETIPAPAATNTATPISTATSMAADTPTITPTATNTPVPPAPAFQNAAFVYDGDGRMVKATINGVTTLYVGAHFEVTDPGAGQTVAKYYFAGASRIAMRKYVVPQSMALEYFLGDHLGSTSVTTDADGALVSEQRYTAWGEPRYSSGSLPTDYTYTGQRSYTADFGLMFYNARWYDPALGRFAQADTIVPQGLQGLDRYAYVINNPIRFTDPTGHNNCDKIPTGPARDNCNNSGYGAAQRKADAQAELEKEYKEGTACVGWSGLQYDICNNARSYKSISKQEQALILAGVVLVDLLPVIIVAIPELVAAVGGGSTTACTFYLDECEKAVDEGGQVMGELFEGASTIADESYVAIHPAAADISIATNGLDPLKAGADYVYVTQWQYVKDLTLGQAAEALKVPVEKWVTQPVTLWEVFDDAAASTINGLQPYFGPGLGSIPQWVSSLGLPVLQHPALP